MFCVKLIFQSILPQKGTNILIFYFFEYGAEYGAECSAVSGAKQYFTLSIYVESVLKVFQLTAGLVSRCRFLVLYYQLFFNFIFGNFR